MQVSCGGCVDRIVWTSYSHFRPTLWGQFLMLIEIRGQDCVSGARTVYQGPRLCIRGQDCVSGARTVYQGPGLCIRGQDCVSGARAVYQGQADLVWGTYGYLASISPVHVLLPNI